MRPPAPTRGLAHTSLRRWIAYVVDHWSGAWFNSDSNFTLLPGARKVYGAVVRCSGRVHGGLVPGGYRSSGGLGCAAQHFPHAGSDNDGGDAAAGGHYVLRHCILVL